jgi:TolB-like protein/Flp pilus assembly protein TadD
VIYRFGDHTLDTESLRLTTNGEEIAVEPQVFRLLQYLVEHRDRVVSKDEIIEHVWDGRIVSDGTLTSRINSVRRAVRDDGKSQAVIKTFPRRGIRFVAAVTEENVPEATPPLPDKPSIAVLPFENRSDDPQQEYFADGIAEDIITALSRYHWFFVIARNSSFSYKGSSPDVRQVAEDLGVQYVLEGSVRRGGNRVRITAQLIDALTGRHVWADRYDRDLEDIFAVQDEITQAIVGEVAPSFVAAEANRVERKTPENLDAWDNVVRGNWHLWRNSRQDLAEARRHFERALELEPKNSMALAGLAMAHSFITILGWADDVEESRAVALRSAKQAVDSDERNAWAYTALGFANYFSNDLDNSIAACRRALELNPNLAIAEATLSIAHSWRGDDEDALQHAEKVARLSPRDPQSRGQMALAVAEFGAGHYEQAVKWAKKTTEVSPNFPGGWRYLVASLAHLDRMEEARVAKDQLLRLSPDENLRRMRAAIPAAQPARIERWIEAFRKAGIPE